MRNKLILFLMLALFGSTSFLRADEVTVGSLEGATNDSYLPMNSLYNYSYSQQIYTAEEIGMAGTINSITMWMYGTATLPARTFDIYLKEVEKETFDNTTDWVTVAATDMVYSGTVSFNNPSPAEAYTFILTTPFQYSGNNNLMVVFNNLTGTWNSGLNGMVFSNDSEIRAIYARQDTAPYDPAGPVAATATTAKRNVVMFDISGSGPVPPTPTGELAIIPDLFELGDRPTNGWMEDFPVKIYNGGEEATISASMSNTAGINAFTMSVEIEDVVLATGEALDFIVAANANGQAAGEYAEEFTMFSTVNTRDIVVVPVTATFYQAGDADIVEKAKVITGAEFDDTPANLHANYNLYGMTQMKKDAVYTFSISDDYHFHAVGGDDFIAVYKKGLVDANHLTAAVEPVLMGASGIIDDEILLAGSYYLVIASENINNVNVAFTEIEPTTELTYTSPANGATEVAAPVTLKWTGGLNATEYQVLFGTSPVNMNVVLDWTMVDENYGEYVVANVDDNTQYFWQIKARNSHGTVAGPRWGFTTTLVAPHTVTASATEIFTDESTLIKWKHSAGQSGFEGEITVCDGTETSSYIPVYGLWMDDYTRGEMIYPAEMLEEMEGGEINKLTYYISSAATGAWSGDVFNVYLMEVENTTLSSYYTSADATIVYTGALDGQGTTMVINFDTPYTYEGGNLLVGIEETVCGTYKSCSFYGVTATGASASGYSSSSLSGVTFNQRNFLPKTTFTCGDAKGDNRNFFGYNVYDDGVKVNDELILEKQYLLSNLAYNMEGHEIAVTAVYSEGESLLSDPVIVYVSGYSTFTGHVSELIEGGALADVTVKFNGKDEFNNTVVYEGTTNASGNYTINDVKAGNYTGMAQLEGFENAFVEGITLEYDTPETVDFIMHELYVPVLSVVAEEMDPEMSRVKWSLNVDIPVPNPGGNTPGGGGSASSFTEGFESGMPAGWSVIDGNNDGYTWCLTSDIPSTWTYYASLTLDWYRTGTNAICSGSYINGVGAITPNEYLVMGQQTLVNGSTLSFWAAATDASYPADHFGVFVSDDASDWTSVQEWTLTGKGTRNGGLESREGKGAKLGTWYNYTVDLSAYAGTKYLAIRHFNCNDQYIMCVDDIELSTAKSTRDVYYYDLYRVAILTEDGEPVNVGDIEDPDPYYIATVGAPDTLYADFEWANQIPGLYQYGVRSVYPMPAKGNRSQIVYDFENGQIPSEFTNTSSYPWVIADANGGKVIKSSNEGVSSSTSAISLTVDYLSDGTFSFDADCMGEGTSTFWDKCTFYIDNEQQFQCGANNPGWQNHTYQVAAGSHEFKWEYSKDSSVNPTGDYFAVDNITITYEGGGDTNDDPITPVTWSNVLPKDIEATVILNAQVPDASSAGASVTFNNTFENSTFTILLDETGTDTITDFRKGNYVVTFTLDGYTSNIVGQEISIWSDTEITGVFEEIFKPVDYVNVSRTGYVSWTPIIPVDRVAENYLVTLDGYEYAETSYNFLQIDEDDLTVGQTYTVGVAVMYTTGISATVTTTFTYADCSYASHQVEDLEATNQPGNTSVTLAWNGATPTPPTPPTPPTGGWTEGFEGGLNGWTVLTILSDGGEWLHSDNNPGGYDYTSHAHGGSGFAMCYSFIDYVGSFNTDSYLITPQMNSVTAGSTLSFWADNANDSYPENFSVCISTAANPTSAADFTTVWSGGAKGTGSDGAMVRRNNNRYDNWRSHTIDLSAYAGQNVWIAFHDSNYDMYEIWIDDVEFTTAAKLGGNFETAGVGFGAANNALTDDGNWYYYDNGTNEDAIGTGGGNFWWGIMLPAGSYEGNRLTKVAAYDYMAMSGNATIYQGGSSAPAGSALGTVNVSFTGSNNFVEFEFAEPVELDPDQNVWVIFYNGSAATYPAAVCNNTGDANGRWVSLDGSSWADLASYGLDYTFMVRAYIESGSGPAPSALVPNKYNIFFDGELVGSTTNNTFSYDAGDFATHEYVVIWVDADYLESCVVEGENLINYAAAPLGVAENMVSTSLYPNPTDGEIRINANNMVRISIVNALGQVVYDKAAEGNEAIINMAQFGNGVYMVNIATENGTTVKRVVVNK